MALERFRDAGSVIFAGFTLGCINSVTVAYGSDVLRGRCGGAISERYQGLTNLNVEVTVESSNPFVDIHPGKKGALIIDFPSADPLTGLPGVTGMILSGDAVLTTHAGRVTKDEIGSGTYTFRGISTGAEAGLSPPFAVTSGASGSSGGAPKDFIRDIKSFSFDGSFATIISSEFCVRSFEFSENSELIEDACQGELWPTYVGVSGLNLTATVTGRNLRKVEAGGERGLGSKGKITFDVLTGSEEDCASLVPGGKVEMDRMNINEINLSASTGEMGEISISFTGHGEVGEDGTNALTAIAKFTAA